MCTKVHSLKVIEYIWRFAFNVVVWSVNLAVQIKLPKYYLFIFPLVRKLISPLLCMNLVSFLVFLYVKINDDYR